MKTFASKGVEHASDILSEKSIIHWEIFKNKYSLTDREHFKCVELIDAVPKEWKDIIRSDSYENDPRTILDCSNIIFINQKPLSVKTLTSKVIYAELINPIQARLSLPFKGPRGVFRDSPPPPPYDLRNH